ncbi:hypothetical protein C8R46DRAFT_884511 [Mycena filopes]|nr:hypothetical protein C8R46DRAFT_884511 [Mycena filopes]
MHRTLQIAEVVDMVCDHLDPGDVYPSTQEFHALAMVARTCRNFYGPALDRLWRSTSLPRLFNSTMGSDVRSIEGGDSVSRTMVRVGFCHTCESNVRYTFCSVYLGYTPRRTGIDSAPFLPRASSIWQVKSEPARTCQVADDILFFHPPTLTQINLALSAADISSVLPTLMRRCPHLTDIGLIPISGFAIAGICSFVCHWPAPRALSVPALYREALLHLSQVTTLQSLTLAHLPTALTLLPRPRRTFPALFTLDITTSPIGSTIQVLKLCFDVPLSTLCISLGPIPANETLAMYTAISGGFSHSSLTKLVISDEFSNSDDRNLATYLVSPASLRPILAFTNLTELSLTAHFGFDLDDPTALNIARAFPRIVKLRLQASYPMSVPRATLLCLVPFAQYCPELKELAFPFNATDVPGVPLPGHHNGVVQRRLETLDVGQSSIRSPLIVARFLSGLFPRLEWIPTARTECDNDVEDVANTEAIRWHRKWVEVEELLYDVCAIREDERMAIIKRDEMARSA